MNPIPLVEQPAQDAVTGLQSLLHIMSNKNHGLGRVAMRIAPRPERLGSMQDVLHINSRAQASGDQDFAIIAKKMLLTLDFSSLSRSS